MRDLHSQKAVSIKCTSSSGTEARLQNQFIPSPDCEWPLPPHHAAGQWGGTTGGLLFYRV